MMRRCVVAVISTKYQARCENPSAPAPGIKPRGAGSTKEPEIDDVDRRDRERQFQIGVFRARNTRFKLGRKWKQMISDSPPQSIQIVVTWQSPRKHVLTYRAQLSTVSTPDVMCAPGDFVTWRRGGAERRNENVDRPQSVEVEDCAVGTNWLSLLHSPVVVAASHFQPLPDAFKTSPKALFVRTCRSIFRRLFKHPILL